MSLSNFNQGKLTVSSECLRVAIYGPLFDYDEFQTFMVLVEK